MYKPQLFQRQMPYHVYINVVPLATIWEGDSWPSYLEKGPLVRGILQTSMYIYIYIHTDFSLNWWPRASHMRGGPGGLRQGWPHKARPLCLR